MADNDVGHFLYILFLLISRKPYSIIEADEILAVEGEEAMKCILQYVLPFVYIIVCVFGMWVCNKYFSTPRPSKADDNPSGNLNEEKDAQTSDYVQTYR